ncbi:MAG: FixH family protein [Deltaproteobacteria bacterium]|nr:FixH family protein [Deltaproteobacteria bacterium]
MNKLISLFLILFFLTLSSPAQAAEARKMLGPYEVTIRISRNPPIVGDNPLEIEIKDPGGRRITEAQVLVNYYMPPMPRMAPMNFTEPAKQKGDRYQMVMRLIMDGPWVIALKITLGGKMSTVKFQINAR